MWRHLPLTPPAIWATRPHGHGGSTPAPAAQEDQPSPTHDVRTQCAAGDEQHETTAAGRLDNAASRGPFNTRSGPSWRGNHKLPNNKCSIKQGRSLFRMNDLTFAGRSVTVQQAACIIRTYHHPAIQARFPPDPRCPQLHRLSHSSHPQKAPD